MFGRMLVPGGIAATDMPAGEAQPEVNPFVADLKTFFATRRPRLDFVDLANVSAACHGCLLRSRDLPDCIILPPIESGRGAGA